LLLHFIAQQLDPADERAVAVREQAQVLVAREELPEALSREEHLVGVQRPALVDRDEPLLERRAGVAELGLGRAEVLRGPPHVAPDRDELLVQ
jgi:hypothetical protein